MANTERKSIFSTRYIGNTDAAQFEAENKIPAYLKISNVDEQFWELLITKLTETHVEQYSMLQTLSNGTSIFSSGSAPVRIEIDGYLAAGEDMDYRVRFLKKYIMEFRENRLRAKNRMLEVHVRHTYFYLEISSISMVESVELPEYMVVGITGIAHEYNTDDGEKMLYSYYEGEEPAQQTQKDVKISSKPADL